ncbi:hypothetical protein EDD17DRAFT_629073 [Pisolithus thermaeus]|nr:hypothetical protein EV401DRAFT_435935 [Pisolithus croceorrhizus]KAI6168574.1 hypothetical protein EDD17DRAFT_629073 [Pisolithus thermaeus]
MSDLACTVKSQTPVCSERGLVKSNIFSPLTLPCGRAVDNRLVKVAMYEHLSDFSGGPPNTYHFALYSEWARHGWAMIITGNVQVDKHHLTLGRDMVIPSTLTDETLAPFKRLAQVIHGDAIVEDGNYSDNSRRTPGNVRPLAIMQISHTGRQSPTVIGGRSPFVPPKAPSSVRIGSVMQRGGEAKSSSSIRSTEEEPIKDGRTADDLFLRVLFQVPREMTIDDIRDVQRGFLKAAVAASKSGFDGIQLHCAHGYLLAQFMSPKTNLRQDQYSIHPSVNSLRMLRETVEAIRAMTPRDFVVGVKINSGDYVQAGEHPSAARIQVETNRVLDHTRTIAHWGMIDFIEVSGGDYESPDFMTSKQTSPRQAFFSRFSRAVIEHINRDPAPSNASPAPVILLTGGLLSPAHLQTALDAGHADLLGIGRGSITCPDLPVVLQERLTTNQIGYQFKEDTRPFTREPGSELKPPFRLPKVGLIGASFELAWYTVRMRGIAESHIRNDTRSGKSQSRSYPRSMGTTEAMLRMWIWVNRAEGWWFLAFVLMTISAVIALPTALIMSRQ